MNNSNNSNFNSNSNSNSNSQGYDAQSSSSGDDDDSNLPELFIKRCKKKGIKLKVQKSKLKTSNIDMTTHNNNYISILDLHTLKYKNKFGLHKSKVAGHDWLQKKHIGDCKGKCNCSALKPIHVLNKHLTKEEIIVSSNYKGYRLFTKMKINQFFKIINNKNKNIFEVISPDNQIRAYVDIDSNNKDCLQNSINELKKVFGNNYLKNMAVSGSTGIKNDKIFYSYHIVLTDIIFKNMQHLIKSGFKNFIKQISNKDNGLDSNVYSRFQQMKAVNQSKYKSKRIQKIITNKDISKHLCQAQGLNAEDCCFYSGTGLDEYKFKNGGTLRKPKISIKKLFLTKYLHFSNTPTKSLILDLDRCSPTDILYSIPNTKKEHKMGKSNHYGLGVWFAKQGGSYTQYRIWESKHYLNNNDSPYTTETDFNNFLKCEYCWSIKKIKSLLEKYYIKIIDPSVACFKKQFITDDTTIDNVDTTLVFNRKYISKDDINSFKYQVMKINMGGGKTYVTISKLIEMVKENPELKVCWITNRISMAYNLIGRLNNGPQGFDLGFKNYKEIKTKCSGKKARGFEKRNIIQNDINRIVIELESLHYQVSSPIDYTTYDVIVMDEIESLFNCFLSSGTHGGKGKNYTTNYNQFQNLLINSKKVFIMDAFLHKRTINYIKMIDPNSQINLIQRDRQFDKIDKEINYNNTFYGWYNKIINDLKQGKKLYIFYPYKSAKGSVYKMSILDFKQRLINQIETLNEDNVLCYYGDMNDKEKRKLIDVNDIWNNSRVVITNSCITVGVNYEFNDFDKIYLSYADHISPRDCIQSSFRIRNTKENVIEFYNFKNIMKIISNSKGQLYEPQTIAKPHLENKDITNTAFQYMRDFLLEEYDSKGLEILETYFKETGYKIKQLPYTGDVDKSIFKSDSNNDYFEYDNCQTIDASTNEDLQSKIFDNNATVAQKLSVRRFYTDIKFKKISVVRVSDCDAGASICHNDLSINKFFFNKPRLLSGLIALYKKNKILSNAIIIENGVIEFTPAKLSLESKIEIERFIHLSKTGVGKNHYDKFMKMTDNTIKKHIIKFYFGINILNPIRDIERGKKDTISDRFKPIIQQFNRFSVYTDRDKLNRDIRISGFSRDDLDFIED